MLESNWSFREGFENNENNPTKFLDTQINIIDNKVSTSVYRKPNKQRISVDFEAEKEKIRTKFENAGFPQPFTESVISQFENKADNTVDNEEMIIPHFLFEEQRRFILVEIPFCETNESLVKRLLQKLKKSLPTMKLILQLLGRQEK